MGKYGKSNCNIYMCGDDKMKTIAETKLFFLKEDSASLFGDEKGSKIYDLAEKIYEKLCIAADYKNSDAIEFHLSMNLYPTMAYYKALRNLGYNEAETLMYVRKETVKAAEIKKADQAKVVNMPYAYLMYRLFVKGVMKKNFPDVGWETEWVRCDGKEIHFNLKRCIYKDLCEHEGCPELCSVFCENDEIAFSGLLPKIRFERAGTLGKDAECCDFHFIKNK